MTQDQIRTALEHAPTEPGVTAQGLEGFTLAGGLFVCSFCTGRMSGRGVFLPGDSAPVWTDDNTKHDNCCGCGKSGKV